MGWSKRRLGEGYIAATSVMFAGILAGVLAVEGPRVGVWVVLGLLPVVALAAVVYWLRTLDFDSDQVWRVAQYAALGTGVVTLLVVGAHLAVQFRSASTERTLVLTATIAASTGAGALVGVATELESSTQRLSVRNAVLYRVLQHYLRNDMTVVLAHLDDVKSSVDGPERERIEAAERKIDTLLALTDNVCQVSAARENGDHAAASVDLVPLVEQRVTHLRRVHPELDLKADLPDAACVEADERIALVVDNVVESAVRYSTDRPEIRIEGAVDGDDVRLRFEDRRETIPDADLSLVATGVGDAPDCGRGIELWLVSLLTERSGGDVTVDTEGGTRRIEVRLDRARPTESRIGTLSRQA